jgi:long-chain acyl-CoA synthetase
VVAFLVCRTPVSAHELDSLCLDNIARFKRPKDYRFVESLPKNNYGKVLKTELRKLLDGNADKLLSGGAATPGAHSSGRR